MCVRGRDILLSGSLAGERIAGLCAVGFGGGGGGRYSSMVRNSKTRGHALVCSIRTREFTGNIVENREIVGLEKKYPAQSMKLADIREISEFPNFSAFKSLISTFFFWVVPIFMGGVSFGRMTGHTY